MRILLFRAAPVPLSVHFVHHQTPAHTLTHPNLNSLSDSAASKEILETRAWLNETCRIPMEQLVGFRSPFLVNRPEIRKVRPLRLL